MRFARFVFWCAGLFWLLLAACAYSLVASPNPALGFDMAVRVEHLSNHDTKGVQYFHLHFGQHGTVLVAGDGDIPLIKTLLSTGKAKLVLEPVEPQELSR